MIGVICHVCKLIYFNFNLILVAQNKDAVPSSSSVTSVEQNPAYRISAALTYTAQLVHVLAFYLDVKLPYKLLYR